MQVGSLALLICSNCCLTNNVIPVLCSFRRAAAACTPCTLKLHYFEKFLAQNLQHPNSLQQSPSTTQEPVAALMTGLHIADIYMVILQNT